MNQLLMEKVGLKQAKVPADMNGAATVGERIKLDKGNRLSILLSMGDSVGAVTIFNLLQHNAATGGVSKDLEVANPYYHKAGAATTFTKVEPGAATAEFDVSAIFAAQEGILAIEVLAEDLDVNGGFFWASVDAEDSTAAKLLAPVYVVHESYDKPAYSVAL